jgi:hypothetical protein
MFGTRCRERFDSISYGSSMKSNGLPLIHSNRDFPTMPISSLISKPLTKGNGFSGAASPRCDRFLTRQNLFQACPDPRDMARGKNYNRAHDSMAVAQKSPYYLDLSEL